MTNNIDGKGVTVSVKIYERLLAIYPADFRREYGPAMGQLFRDQCRDAWSHAQGRGLAILWLRVALDLARTSLKEHLASLHRRESMGRKMVRGFRFFLADAGLRSIFGRVFATALLCVFAFSLCQMFWTPKVYSSTTRIEVQKDAAETPAAGGGRSDPYFVTTQFKIIESYSILTNVIATLHLDEKLAAQAGEAHWTVDQTYANLFDKISVGQTRMTGLIQISVKNRDPKLAADIANAIVDAYRSSRLEKWKGDHYGGIIALQTKLNDEETRLRNMEVNLTELRESLGVSDLDEESLKAGVTNVTEQLREFQNEEAKAMTDYLECSNFLAGLATIPKGERGEALALNAHRPDLEFSELSTRLQKAKDKWTAAQSGPGEKRPDYEAAQKQLNEAQSDYDNKVDAIIAGLKERVAIDRQIMRISQQLKSDLETKKDQLVSKGPEYINLKRKCDELRHNNRELNRMIQMEMDPVAPPLKSIVIVRDPARPILRPIQSMSDIFTKWMFAGTLAALVAGGLGAWFAHRIRRFSQPPQNPT